MNPDSQTNNPFPKELTERRQWLCWKIGKDGESTTKTPYNPTTGAHAECNSPSTWVDYATAKAAVDAGHYESIGFVLTDDTRLRVIDFDKVTKKANEPMPEWVKREVEDLDSYTELSVSGTGYHVLVWYDSESGLANINRQKQHVEVWSNNKMFALSGAVVGGRATIEKRNVSAVYNRILSGKFGPDYRQPIIAERYDSEKFKTLCKDEWHDYFDSRSGAVQSVLITLAYRFDCDEEKIRKAFEDTPLCAAWEEKGKWTRLGESEIESAITFVKARPRKDTPAVDPNNWQPLFHTYEDFCNAPPVTFAIEGFLQETGVTMIGGLPGHGKTFVMLSMAKALLTGKPLFGYPRFSVPTPSSRVVYLCPEVGLGPLTARLKKFGLGHFVKDGRLLYQTLSIKLDEQVKLTDPRMLTAIQGADVFLDTAVRFMEGEENSATEQKQFAKTLFALLNAGARTVTGAHHAPKSFADASYMSLENALRGTSELGAMLSTAWGVKKIDEATNRIFVENIKPRDFEPCKPFMLEGRPFIDSTGDFKMVAEPGDAGKLADHQPSGRAGRPAILKYEDVKPLKDAGKTNRQIATLLGVGSKDAVARALRRPPAPVNSNEVGI